MAAPVPNSLIFAGNFDLEKYIRSLVAYVNANRGPTGPTGPSTGVTGPTGATGPTGP